jgi:hypothetical protein
MWNHVCPKHDTWKDAATTTSLKAKDVKLVCSQCLISKTALGILTPTPVMYASSIFGLTIITDKFRNLLALPPPDFCSIDDGLRNNPVPDDLNIIIYIIYKVNSPKSS